MTLLTAPNGLWFPKDKVTLIDYLLKVPKWVTPFGVTIDRPFVEHQAVPFLLSDQFHLFGGLIAMEMIWVDD